MVEVEGEIEADALATAYRRLGPEAPRTTGRIGRRSRTPDLRGGAGDEPRFSLVDGGPKAVQHVADRRWDSTRELAELVLVRGRGRSFVLLRTAHTIVDGPGGPCSS